MRDHADIYVVGISNGGDDQETISRVYKLATVTLRKLMKSMKSSIFDDNPSWGPIQWPKYLSFLMF